MGGYQELVRSLWIWCVCIEYMYVATRDSSFDNIKFISTLCTMYIYLLWWPKECLVHSPNDSPMWITFTWLPWNSLHTQLWGKKKYTASKLSSPYSGKDIHWVNSEHKTDLYLDTQMWTLNNVDNIFRGITTKIQLCTQSKKHLLSPNIHYPYYGFFHLFCLYW